MSRIIFAILALVFMQLVNGQDSAACTTAQTNLATNTACVTAFSTGTDTDTLCTGTCRDLFDAIIAECDASTAAGYSTLLSTLCDGTTNACTTAQTNLATNTACVTAFSTGTDTDAICTGTCRDLFNAIISSCDATTAAGYSTLLSTLCTGTGDACQTAQANIVSNTACANAISAGDVDNYCMETCRNLLNAVVSSCDASSEAAMGSVTLLSYCGTGTTTACLAAGEAIDDSCTDALDTANPAILCSGTCNTQLSAAATACADSTNPDIQVLLSAYNTACDSGNTPCQTALTALNADGSCITALDNGDTANACSGSCAVLVNAVLNACPNNAYISDRRTGYNELCGTGTGSGSVIIQASGIITLLLAAMCALLF